MNDVSVMISDILHGMGVPEETLAEYANESNRTGEPRYQALSDRGNGRGFHDKRAYRELNSRSFARPLWAISTPVGNARGKSPDVAGNVENARVVSCTGAHALQECVGDRTKYEPTINVMTSRGRHR